MTDETNGPGREPVAWIDPKYVVGRPYGTGQSPVTTYRINGWTPLYAAPPAAPPAPAADAREILHVLRNTHGYTESYIRAMRLAAAALIEQQARELAEWKRAYDSVQAACMKANEDCGRAEAELAAMTATLHTEQDRTHRYLDRAERAEAERDALVETLRNIAIHRTDWGTIACRNCGWEWTRTEAPAHRPGCVAARAAIKETK